MTLGEKTIRTNFNVTGDSNIDKIKNLYAQLFDEVNAIAAWHDKTEKSSESNRLVAIAKTHLETSAMFAVKALTV